MSQTTKESEIELTAEEKKVLGKLTTNLSPEQFLEFANKISIITRATQGKTVEQTSIYDKLIDIKDIKERSRYPTYPILSLIVYLENIAKANPNAKACSVWSNHLSKALISYKGQSRSEFVDMSKAPQPPQQEFYLGSQRYIEPRQQKKAHFWSRPPKQDYNELSKQ